jgi:hypothetical protein
LKRSFGYPVRWNFVGRVTVLLALIAPAGSLIAAQLKEAHVTQIIKEVQLLPAEAAPRPAVVNDNIRSGTAVRTGADSRTELTFTDLTLARLGANTIFSFNEGTRNIDLGSGAVLLQVPKGAGGAKITTAAVTAAITGTTVLMEYHRNAYIKFVVLEGIARMYLKGRLGESVLIGPGQMLIVNPNAKSLPDPVHVDLKRLVQTCLLITEFAPLASQSLILQEIQNQQHNRDLIPTNMVIFGRGTLVSLVDPTNLNVISQQTVAVATPTPSPTPTPTPTPTPSGTPSKFGPPITITSPNPYVITSGTVMTTDPTITTNGITDFGKVWRGTAIDGPLSAFIFGSTSSFDTAIGFDSYFDTSSGGGFKFTALQLTGNPTVITTNGQINLGLIAVDGITSGSPGGVLTFSGIRGLLLATQDGPITLGREISFSGLHDLTLYARGSLSDLTLGSDISTSSQVRLFAEHDIAMTSNITTQDIIALAGNNFGANGGSLNSETLDISAGGDVNLGLNTSTTLNAVTLTLSAGNNLNWSGGTLSATATNSDGNVTISAGNKISITGGLEVDRTFGGQSSGLNVSFTAGTDLTAGNDLTILADNSINGNLDSGADITLNAGGSLTVNGGGDLDLTVMNNNGGHIGAGGNISVTTGGDLTAGSIDAEINNRDAGSIGSGVNLTFDIGGALTTQGDATFGISNRNDGTGGGTIGSLATVDINAASVSVGGFFQTFISTNGGGSIQGDAINTVDVTGDLTAQGGILLDIADTAFGGTGVFTGGRIDGNAIVTLSAQNITTPSTASGVPGTDTMAIEASIYPNASGTVGGDAIVNVFASQNISAPGSVLFWVANGNYQDLGGGTIGGNAEVNVSAVDISTGDLFTQILNYGGASIGGVATINTTADTLSVGGNLAVLIDNSNGGVIGGNATINMNISGTATVTSDATIEILGSDGAAASAININGGSYDAGGTFLAFTDGNGTITFNNASVHADVLKVGALGTNGVLNIGGGVLTADATLKLYAPGSNGQLNFTSNVTLDGISTKILAANAVTIFDNVVVTIGDDIPASVYTNHPNYTGFGGNGSRTGTFAGAGANQPLPLSQAPPFNDPPRSRGTVTSGGNVASRGNVTSGKRAQTAINVSSTDALLSLLDGAAPDAGGKITIPASRSASYSRNSSRINAAGRWEADRDAMDIRTAYALPARRSPQ